MESLREYIDEYRKQLKTGYLQAAYKGLMEYITNLRSYLKNKYPGYYASASVQYGFMDYSYFYFFPGPIRRRNLKIVILFVHDTFTFEAWLAGYNKNVQTKYLKLFKESNWNKYKLAPSVKGVDYILNYTLADNPDFSNPEALTKRIEKGISIFIRDIEEFLSKH